MLLDRYVLREIIPPALVGFFVFTFALLMNTLLEFVQILVLRGIGAGEFLTLIWNISLSFLPLTLPMSLLMGVLSGISRMSADYEILALRALAIPTPRLLRPVFVVGFLALLLNLWTNMFVAPSAVKAAEKQLFELMLSRTEKMIRPKEFFEGIPGMVVFVKEKGKGMWKGIFIEKYENGSEKFILAKEGRFVVDRKKREAFFVLRDGEVHSFDTHAPEKYSRAFFKEAVEVIPKDVAFPKIQLGRKPREKNLPQLIQAVKNTQNPIMKNLYLMELHSRLALALSSLLFMLLGFALAVNVKRGGAGYGFALSIIVVVLYFVIHSGAKSFVEQGRAPAWAGMWLSDLMVLLFFLLLVPRIKGSIRPARAKKKLARTVRTGRLLKIPRLFSTLDTYGFLQAFKVFTLILFAFLFLSLLVSFFQLIDDVFQHHLPIGVLLNYMIFFAPQLVYVLLPLTLLTSLMVSISLFYKRGEITAIKAGGISLHRFSLPFVLLATLVVVGSFYLQERILPYSNKKAESLRAYIKGQKKTGEYVISRNWVFSNNTIFHFLYYEKKRKAFVDIYLLKLSENFSLQKIVHAKRAFWKRKFWVLRKLWIRDFTKKGEFLQADRQRIKMPPPEYFFREIKSFEEMNLKQLRLHIETLRREGFPTTELEVEYQVRLSFPFVNLVMALLAISLGFLIGERGPTIGVGTSLAIGGIYWTLFGAFKALGKSYILPPILAGWSPSIIFLLIALILFTYIKT